MKGTSKQYNLSGRTRDYLDEEMAKGKSATEVIDSLIANQMTFDAKVSEACEQLHRTMLDRYNSPEIAHIAYQVRDSIRKADSCATARIHLIEILGKYICNSIEDKEGGG